MRSTPPRNSQEVPAEVVVFGLGLAVCILPFLLALGVALAGDAAPLIPVLLGMIVVAASTGAREPETTPDIVFLDPVPTRPSVVRLVHIHALGAACSYCGSDFGELAIECPSCETPHHRQCWRENGGCTVYGCTSAPRRRRVAQG